MRKMSQILFLEECHPSGRFLWLKCSEKVNLILPMPDLTSPVRSPVDWSPGAGTGHLGFNKLCAGLMFYSQLKHFGTPVQLTQLQLPGVSWLASLNLTAKSEIVAAQYRKCFFNLRPEIRVLFSSPHRFEFFFLVHFREAPRYNPRRRSMVINSLSSSLMSPIALSPSPPSPSPSDRSCAPFSSASSSLSDGSSASNKIVEDAASYITGNSYARIWAKQFTNRHPFVGRFHCWEPIQRRRPLN